MPREAYLSLGRGGNYIELSYWLTPLLHTFFRDSRTHRLTNSHRKYFRAGMHFLCWHSMCNSYQTRRAALSCVGAITTNLALCERHWRCYKQESLPGRTPRVKEMREIRRATRNQETGKGIGMGNKNRNWKWEWEFAQMLHTEMAQNSVFGVH